MILRRRLVRGLRGGEQITIDRAWAVTFNPVSKGAEIVGHQISADVGAPEMLSSLARVEQERSTDAMFPIQLDAHGALVAAGPFTLGEDLAIAVDIASQLIAERPVFNTDKQQQLDYITGMQRAATDWLDSLPSDLFYPVREPIRTVQRIDMSSGSMGEFELLYEATPHQDGPWLGRAKRQIVTRIGGGERASSEEWTLDEA